MVLLLTLPFTLTSIILYLSLTFFGNSIFTWILALILSAILFIFLTRKQFNNGTITHVLAFVKSNTLPLVMIALFLLAKFYIISPLIIPKHLNGFTHLQIAGVGDYYKHTFVVNSLVLNGLPPKDPYFPEFNLSYYYGYYLLPAAFTKIFHIYPNIIFYFFNLITDFTCLVLLLYIFSQFIKSIWAKTTAILLLITGVGVDIIPNLFNPKFFEGNTVGLQLINNYKTFIYVPQHLFAATLTIAFIYSLIKLPKKISLISPVPLIFLITFSFILLCSLFVSLTFLIWLTLTFVFFPNTRKLLALITSLSLIILIPYLKYLSDRPSLISFYHFTPYPFSSNFILNTLFTFLVKYGPILIITPLIFLLTKPFKKNFFYLLALLVPLAVTWFFRSPLFNDFSLRTSIPIQLILPIFFIVTIQQCNTAAMKFSLISLTTLTLILGSLALFSDYKTHWQNRLILHPKDSEYLLKVRTLPTSLKLAAIDRDRWVELTPSLGFREIHNPFLYDSSVYFLDKNNAHSEYEKTALDLFTNPTISNNLDNLINIENNNLKKLPQFFNSYSADLLILPNQLWVKKDVNPWLAIFQNLGVKSTPFTSNFTAIDYPNLQLTMNNYQLTLNNSPLTLTIKNRTFPLSKGLWYLTACTNKADNLHLELEDYYLLFNENLNGLNQACVGKIFYLQQSDNLLLTTTSHLSQVTIFPIALTGKLK